MFLGLNEKTKELVSIIVCPWLWFEVKFKMIIVIKFIVRNVYGTLLMLSHVILCSCHTHVSCKLVDCLLIKLVKSLFQKSCHVKSEANLREIFKKIKLFQCNNSVKSIPFPNWCHTKSRPLTSCGQLLPRIGNSRILPKMKCTARASHLLYHALPK